MLDGSSKLALRKVDSDPSRACIVAALRLAFVVAQMCYRAGTHANGSVPAPTTLEKSPTLNSHACLPMVLSRSFRFGVMRRTPT